MGEPPLGHNDLQKLSTADVAQVLDVSPARVRQLIKDGRLAATKEQGEWQIEQASVHEERERRGLPPLAPRDEPRGKEEQLEEQEADDSEAWWERFPLPEFVRRKFRLRSLRQEVRDYHRPRDLDHNRLTTPPDTERIKLRHIWLAEVYTPATVDQLLEGLRNLGGDQETFFRRPSPTDWVISHRGNPSVSGVMNIGHVLGPDRQSFSDGYRAKLPTGISSVYLTLHAVGPSITILVAQFLLKDELALVPDRTLRRSYTTYMQPRDGLSFTVMTPEQQKEKAYEEAIDYARRTCADWLVRVVPGLFALEGSDAFPDLLAITTQERGPHTRREREEGKPGWLDWMRVAGLESAWNVMQSDEIPGWHLALDGLGSDRPIWELVLTCREQDIGEDQLKHYGRGSRQLDSYLAHRLPGLVAKWACVVAARTYQQRLAEQRDYIPNNQRGIRRTIRDLEGVRQRLVETTSDARVVAADLKRLADSEHAFHYNAADWTKQLRDLGADLYPDGLLEYWRVSLQWNADQLVNMQASIEDTLTTDSSLRSVIANLRTQRFIFWLTTAILFLTTVSVIATVRGA